MSENTTFEPQLSKTLFLPTKIPFVSLVNLNYKNTVLSYHYILNLINKKSMQICLLSHHRSNYSLPPVLPLGPKCLKYLLSGPFQETRVNLWHKLVI